jgi:uncharacterized lipoprotein YajG
MATFQDLHIGEMSIPWTIYDGVARFHFIRANEVFGIGDNTEASISLKKKLDKHIVKIKMKNSKSPMVEATSDIKNASKYITTNIGKQRWSAFMAAIQRANITGIAPQVANVPPIVGIDAATAQPIFGDAVPLSLPSTYACSDTQELLNSVDIRSIPVSDRVRVILALTAQNRQAAAMAEKEVLEKMVEISANPRMLNLLDNLSKTQLENVSFLDMQRIATSSSSSVVHQISRPVSHPPMRRTIGDKTFVNAPSMMQQGEIISNSDGTGVRNGRVTTPSSARFTDIVHDEVDDNDNDVDADMIDLSEEKPSSAKNAHSLAFLMLQLTSWKKQVLADPNCRKAIAPFVVVANSKVKLQEVRGIEGFKVIIYKGKNFPYGKIGKQRADTIDIKKPVSMYLAAKPVYRGEKTSYKISCLMRN